MDTLFDWDDLPADGASGSAVSRRRLEGTGACLVRVEIKAGTRADRHTHAHEQFVQVLAGNGTLETAEGCRPFATGSLFHFPPETWHAAVFETDTVLVETNLAEPRRT